MAMLAERRRKVKWSLNPRGNDWMKDNNKFGQKLLEKMGWTPGNGLGAKGQGIKECLRVSVKCDSKGLGMKETGDEWIKEASRFNEFLAELNKESHVVETNAADAPTSLEHLSKNSRSRVHYHKFTRGKDLTNYSTKDLSSILGGVNSGSSASDVESSLFVLGEGDLNNDNKEEERTEPPMKKRKKSKKKKDNIEG